MVRIIYGLKDPSIKMVDKECIYLFHWTQFFDKHTKQLIKLELQDEYNALYHQYKNATSLGEADSHYVLICCWWFASKIAFKVGVHELGNWLNFWHFCVR